MKMTSRFNANKTFLLIAILCAGSFLSAQSNITVTIGKITFNLLSSGEVQKTENAKTVSIGAGFKSIRQDIVMDWLIGTKTNNAVQAYIDDEWTPYLQELTCGGRTVKIKADRTSEPAIGPADAQYDIIRCENANLIGHSLNGDISICNDDRTAWISIKQIISIGNASYYLKPDGSVWMAGSSRRQDVRLGTISADYLQSNDDELISVRQGVYSRYENGAWNAFSPNFLPTGLEMTDPGLWFFIQNKSTLNRRLGLTFNDRNQLVMEVIPDKGNCDRFLWRTEKTGTNRFRLINKSLGGNRAFGWNTGGPAIADASSANDWTIVKSNENVYGTNAFRVTGNTQTLVYSDRQVRMVDLHQGDNVHAVWQFHFNQMVKGYLLPRHADADIPGTFDRKLTGPYNLSYYASQTTSDWALVNAYFIINNVTLALKDQEKTSRSVNGHKMFLISKDDPNETAANALKGLFTRASMGQLRGGAHPSLNRTLVTEEMMCRTGVVNRPRDKAYREFEQVVHEYAHILQDKLNLIPEVDRRALCPDETGENSECFCWIVQGWFNSVKSSRQETYPGARIQRDRPNPAAELEYLSILFNPSNIWMPPVGLRNAAPGDLRAVQEGPAYRYSLRSSGDALVAGTPLFYSYQGSYYVDLGSGNLVVRPAAGGFRWGTHNDLEVPLHAAAVKFEDGELRFFDKNNAVFWKSNIAGNSAAEMIVTENGDLKIIDANDNELWPMRTRGDLPLAGGTEMVVDLKYYAPDQQHYLVWQSDGNLVVYRSRDNGFVWGTFNQKGVSLSGKYARMQTDGNFCIYNQNNSWIWGTQTTTSGSTLSVNGQGALVILAPGGQEIWKGGK